MIRISLFKWRFSKSLYCNDLLRRFVRHFLNLRYDWITVLYVVSCAVVRILYRPLCYRWLLILRDTCTTGLSSMTCTILVSIHSESKVIVYRFDSLDRHETWARLPASRWAIIPIIMMLPFLSSACATLISVCWKGSTLTLNSKRDTSFMDKSMLHAMFWLKAICVFADTS